RRRRRAGPRRHRLGRRLFRPLTGGSPMRALQGHRGEALCLAYSPDGRTLATGGGDGRVLLWDLAEARVGWHLNLGRARVLSLAVAPDGRGRAGGRHALVQLIPLDDGKALRLARPIGGSCALAFTPEGARLLCAGYLDKTIAVLDAASGVEHAQ